MEGGYSGVYVSSAELFDPAMGIWTLLLSGSHQTRVQQWGWSQAIPVPADYDGDGKADKVEKVNVNTADEKTIAGAKGVGDKLAKELVAGRPYKTWAEVSKVKGVGDGKKLDALKKVLKLSEGSAPAAATPRRSRRPGSRTRSR